MKQVLSKKTATFILTVLLGLLLIFHLLVISGMFPADIVWGGQMKPGDSIVLFELLALGMTIIFIFTALTRGVYICNRILGKIAAGFIWIMVVYFILNVAGNLAAKTAAEKWIFTPFTVILVLCSLRLAIKEKK